MSNKQYCKNCKATDHEAQNCQQPCKICNGALGNHLFWRCPNYRSLNTRPATNEQSSVSNVNTTTRGQSQPIEHVLLEDEDSDFFSKTIDLEDLFAYEEPLRPARKRIRIEDIEDEDQDQATVRNTAKEPSLGNTSNVPKRNIAKPRSSKKEKAELSFANNAALQLMKEAKISLTLDQICDLAPSFRAEFRRLLVKPRKSKEKETDNHAKSSENMYLNPSGENSGCCPRTLIKVNDAFEVNALLDGGAVPNIISLDLVKKLNIKELLRTANKYITANGQKSQALRIAQNIKIELLDQSLIITAIVYNHNAFPLLLGRKALKKLRIITDWDTEKWYIKVGQRSKIQIPINFNIEFGIKEIAKVKQAKEDSEMEEASDNDSEISNDTSETISGSEDEVYVLELGPRLQQTSTTEIPELQILANQPEVQPMRNNQNEIQAAIEKSISKVPVKFQEYVAELKALCMEFIDIFGTSHKNLKATNILEFDIDTGNSSPVYIKPRPLPYQYKEFVKAELSSAVEAGIMTGPLKKLCKWGSPVWVVVKPKTNELRMVGDFRMLNQKTINDEFAIPDMKEVIEELSESVVFSPLDFLKAYNQIKATTRAQERLVLATEFGNYQYNVMPFGPKTAPATLAKATCIAFSEIRDIVASYFDDITTHSKNPKVHLSHLRKVFEVTRKYNFTLRPDKCLFFQEEIEILGYSVSPKGIKPSGKILHKVSIVELPTNKTNVKAFVHLCGFLHDNVQGFADLAAPLTELLKKDTKFIFGEKELRAWNLLKEQTLKASELAFFNPRFEGRVYTDASDVGIGGVYTQINDKGEERPVKFLSRKLTLPEKKYDTVSKELLAIVYVLQKLRKYLLGREFTLYTDSNAVKWLFTKKDLSAKHSRYVILLQDFPCKVIHISGKRNIIADILSRYPLSDVSDNSSELDYFSHVLVIENVESLDYESLLKYIYSHINTLI